MKVDSKSAKHSPSTLQMQRLVRQAQGVEKADLVLKNCQTINVFTRELIEADIAICDDLIAGVGLYSGSHEIDCRRCFVSPGFMEGHIHIESSMLSPEQFVYAVHCRGTTTVVCDPHEIANVAGSTGILYMLEETEGLPVSVFVMAPSCVPATHLETSGAFLDQRDISNLYQHPRVIGLAEMMNYPGVLAADKKVFEKLVSAQLHGLPVDGHAPRLSGKSLQAYISAGIRSDHECTTREEAKEKLRAGMHLFIREGSAARNLEELLPVVNERNVHRCLLVTDDCHPDDLLNEGHLDRILRKAVRLGLDPFMAIQMVTINVARYFSLNDRGAIAPGYRADLVLFEDLHEIRPCSVISGGSRTVKEQRIIKKKQALIAREYPEIFSSVHIQLEKLSFDIPAEKGKLRVIKVIKDQILTDVQEIEATVENGRAVADPRRDLAKIAVIERHRGSGRIGLGFVTGMGMRHGALAASVAHDSHNIIVVGTSDAEMRLAVDGVAKCGGGLAVVSGNQILSLMALRVAGLMATSSLQEVNDDLKKVLHSSQSLGVYQKNPFAILSFLALPVIPHLKITDLGLVDVDTFQLTGLWA